jgi:hypothetical protein
LNPSLAESIPGLPKRLRIRALAATGQKETLLKALFQTLGFISRTLLLEFTQYKTTTKSILTKFAFYNEIIAKNKPNGNIDTVFIWN